MTNKITQKNRSVGRPKAFDEQEALTAAMYYFWEHGYDNTSLDSLLVAMGIKKSSFYATFKSKEEIFSRTLELYRVQNLQHLRQLKSEVGAKKAMLTLTELTIKELQETGKVRGCLLINSGKECYNKYDDLSHQIKEDFNYILDLFVEFTQDAKDAGEITSTKKAKVIAGRYMNALNGLTVTIQAGATQELVDDLVESLKEILE
jgi:TetR/AcrR family transcriptional repressor of nem operon